MYFKEPMPDNKKRGQMSSPLPTHDVAAIGGRANSWAQSIYISCPCKGVFCPRTSRRETDKGCYWFKTSLGGAVGFVHTSQGENHYHKLRCFSRAWLAGWIVSVSNVHNIVGARKDGTFSYTLHRQTSFFHSLDKVTWEDGRNKSNQGVITTHMKTKFHKTQRKQ